MTGRMFRGGRGPGGSERDDFGPVIEGRPYGLSDPDAIEVWEHVRADARASWHGYDEDPTRKRLQQVGERAAARGVKLRPEPGKGTRIEAAVRSRSKRRRVRGHLAREDPATPRVRG